MRVRKHRQNQTRQPTATPRQAGCKTNARTRRKTPKTPKTHSGQNAAKKRAHAALTPPRRGAQCAASQLTRPARFQPSRPLSCDADLDGRRDEQNGPAHSLADTTASSGMLRRDGASERRSRTRSAKPRTRRCRGGPPRSLQNESRRWRVGGVEVPSGIGAARRHCNHRSIDPDGRARRRRRRDGAVRWNNKGDQARRQGQAVRVKGKRKY